MQHARLSGAERCGMFAGLDPFPSCFNAYEFHIVAQERVEDTDRIRSATYACHDRVREPAFFLHYLRLRLSPDHGLEIPDHEGVRVRAHYRTEEEIGVLHMRHPVPERLVHCVLEGTGAGFYRDNF